MATQAKKTAPPPPEVKQFGIELRLARIRAGTYQKAIADHMGWHSTAVSQLERGDRQDLPDLATVRKLDRFLKAEGKLLAAAGYQVANSAGSGKTERYLHTITLPEGFTKAERNKVQEYVDLLERARGK